MARTIEEQGDEEARATTAATIAGLRVSAEGQEGIRAFMEKRTASWVSDDV
jgi:methylglutaconyl-CoA hydratase